MRKSTKRKHYATHLPVLQYVIAGVRPIDEAADKLLLARESAALEAFRTGSASIDDWRTIADVANLSETLAEMGVGQEEVTPHIAAVEQYLGEAHGRYVKTGRIGTTGLGLRAMRDLCEYHQLQRTSIDLATLERAIALTRARILSHHPDLKVYMDPIPSPQGAAC